MFKILILYIISYSILYILSTVRFSRFRLLPSFSPLCFLSGSPCSSLSVSSFVPAPSSVSSFSFCIYILGSYSSFLVSFSPFSAPPCCCFSSFVFPMLCSPLLFPLFPLLLWSVFSSFSSSPSSSSLSSHLLLLAFFIVLLFLLLFLFPLLLSDPTIFSPSSSLSSAPLPSSSSASWVLSFFVFSSSISRFLPSLLLSFGCVFISPGFSSSSDPISLALLLYVPFGFFLFCLFPYIILVFPFVCTCVFVICGIVLVYLLFSPSDCIPSRFLLSSALRSLSARFPGIGNPAPGLSFRLLSPRIVVFCSTAPASFSNARVGDSDVCVLFPEFMLSLWLYLAGFMFFLLFLLAFAIPPVSCPCFAALVGLVSVRSSRSTFCLAICIIFPYCLGRLGFFFVSYLSLVVVLCSPSSFFAFWV